MSNMVVNTNVAALNSHRNMKKVGQTQFTAAARLSSGLKINSAADDAAGLAISEKMRSQIRGLDMASKNSQDGISLVQTAEGGLQEIDNMVQRMRELIVYASNDTLDNGTQPNGSQNVSEGDREKIQQELNHLGNEIDAMASRIEFNKKVLLNGSQSNTNPPTGALVLTRTVDIASANSDIDSDLQTFVTALETTFKAVVDGLGLTNSQKISKDVMSYVRSNIDLTGATTYTTNTIDQDLLDGVMEIIYKNLDPTDDMGTLGGSGAALDLNSGGTLYDALVALTDAADELMNDTSTGNAHTGGALGLFKSNFDGVGSGGGIWLQTGANEGQGMNVSIEKVTTLTLGIGDGRQSNASNNNMDLTSTTLGWNINGMTGEDIKNANILSQFDTALTKVTTERAKLGAIQNRLEFTIKSLDVSSENLSASESRIRDADMGKEMMNLTKANVLQQAATSMLAQANQNPQMVLQLLR